MSSFFEVFSPTSGEPQSKEIDGKMMHYCGKCGKDQKGHWNPTHLTKDHKTKEELEAAKAKGPGGNVAELELSSLGNFCVETKFTNLDPEVWFG